MLSAAHILAMNAKSLLDVVDHVRIKHPNVNVLFGGIDHAEATGVEEASYQISSS